VLGRQMTFDGLELMKFMKEKRKRDSKIKKLG